jgi:hypothetical protein
MNESEVESHKNTMSVLYRNVIHYYNHHHYMSLHDRNSQNPALASPATMSECVPRLSDAVDIVTSTHSPTALPALPCHVLCLNIGITVHYLEADASTENHVGGVDERGGTGAWLEGGIGSRASESHTVLDVAESASAFTGLLPWRYSVTTVVSEPLVVRPGRSAQRNAGRRAVLCDSKEGFSIDASEGAPSSDHGNHILCPESSLGRHRVTEIHYTTPHHTTLNDPSQTRVKIPHRTRPFSKTQRHPTLLPPLNHDHMIPLASPTLADLRVPGGARLKLKRNLFKLCDQAAADFPA